MKTFIIVPCFNENNTLATVIRNLQHHFEHIIVIDDGSMDNSYTIAKKSGVTVLRHMINLGQGAALQTGITCALDQQADFIATFDADNQHSATDLYSMVKKINTSGVDVILGSRFLDVKNKLPFFRKIILKCGIIFTRLTTLLDITDTHNGLRLFRAESLRDLNIHEYRMSHASEILEYIAIRRLKYLEIPVRIRYFSMKNHYFRDLQRSLYTLCHFMASKFIKI